MAKTHRRTKFNNVENTGFGANSSHEGGRLTNKDGSVNLRKTGTLFWERISIYHSLLRMSRWQFLGIVFTFYTILNLFFAALYVLIGVDHLQGVEIGTDPISKFLQAFFFSSQTLTTVGYGHISPVGFWANVIASLESFMGILSFAMVTGLLYGRFTRPRAYLRFSDNMIVAPYRGDSRGLMMRVASYKNNHLTDAEAQVTAALHVLEGEKRVTRFYQLPLEIQRINSMALSWTLVHPIDENSPLYGFAEHDFLEGRLELIVSIKAFDDHFSNIVQQRTSYTHQELVYGAKFMPMYHRSEDGHHTILELDKINAFEKTALPQEALSSGEAETVAANA